MGSGLKANTKQLDNILTWCNGKYIKADGIFCEVIKKHGFVYECKKLNKDEIFYIVEKDGKTAHGKSIKEAKEDLIYKISSRDKSEFESLTLDSVITFEKAVEMYRVLTGSCSFGTKDFVENRLKDKKAEYSIKEILEITKNEYGSTSLQEFFK